MKAISMAKSGNMPTPAMIYRLPHDGSAYRQTGLPIGRQVYDLTVHNVHFWSYHSQ
ncbi:MAG: hypothetical protein ACFCUU_07095 [Cyclobacteriaceae bacterium]